MKMAEKSLQPIAVDWVVSPPNAQFEVLTPQCDGVWKCSFGQVIRIKQGHEDGALVMGLVSLAEEEEIPKPSLSAM